MKTIVLPGYSLHNKDWAYSVKDGFEKSGLETEVYDWEHWKTGKHMNLKKEVGKIENEIGKEKVNIIAKSVGTKVIMHVLKDKNKEINKLILCGMPRIFKIEIPRYKLYSNSIKLLEPKNVLVMQNTKDPFGTFEQVERFIKSANPKIRTFEGKRSDHEYPYLKEMISFLKS